MPSYTYDDFLNAANAAGLLGEFSQADLDTAQRYPEFGLSMVSLKQDWHNATTDEQRLLANEAANQLRSSYGNYTGGTAGADYVSQGKIPGQIDTVLDEIYNYGDFSYGSAPTYNNAYAQLQQDLLNNILNREDFSWTKEEDPLWGSYKKSYLREGERATANALGQASAASGGRPSSYAVTAATQAGDYYATQLNDIIPQLEQRAYERYLDDYQMMVNDLNQVNTQEQMDYQKYLTDLSQFNTDRDFAYGQYLNDFNILQQQLGSLQGQDAVDYDRYMDQVGLRLDSQQQQQALAQAQVDAILAAGGVPTTELIGQSGYSQEYVDALEAAYRRELAGSVGNSGGGSYRGSGGGSSGGGSAGGSVGTENEVESLIQRFNAGDQSDAVIAALIAAGFTQEQLEQAGYTGNYFRGNGTGPSEADNLRRQLSSIPGLTQENKVAMVEDWLNHGRITQAEADELLSYLGY